MAKKTKTFSYVGVTDALEQLGQRGSSAGKFVYDLLRIFADWGDGQVRRTKEGAEVKEIFVIEESLKSRNFDTKSIVLLAKSIPQRIIYLLRCEDNAILAVYHTKLFTSSWQPLDSVSVPLDGLTLDAVWQNIVAFVGELEVADGNSLTEQIRVDEERAKLIRQIESLERLMRSTSQPRRQRELYSEIKKLKRCMMHDS